MKKIFHFLYIFSKLIFSLSVFDCHRVIYIFGFRIRKKLPFKKKEIVLSEPCLNNEHRDVKITLSLTTFPDRITTVNETIKTLLNQTLKPDNVVLWLAKEQFKEGEDMLPENLLSLKKHGLSIKWCNDIRSYKKLIPSIKEYPNDIIITFDDDIYYPNDVVERLYKSYLENPSCIHTNRARRLDLKKNILVPKNAVEIYWTRYNDCTFKNTITGCGGVLYPPNSLSKEVLNENKFKEILPTQDDVWFWAMAVLAGTKIKVVSSFDIQLPTVENTQQFGLSKINKKAGSGINSLDGINLIVKKYPEILDKIRNEA